MKKINEEISKESYDRYVDMPYAEIRAEIEKTLPDAWVMGYGWYGCIPVEIDGKFYLQHTIGDSCD